MVYSTCTVLRNENQSQIEGFLAATDAELRPPSEASCLQLMPGEANADGFYYACLGKRTPK